MPGAFHLSSTKARFDPQMSPHMRVLSIGELKSLKHIGWNEEYIAQLVGAGLFPAPVHRGAWRESHIDDWLRARKAIFARDESGVTAIEYGLIIALISIVIIGPATLVGTGLAAVFTNISGRLAAAAG